VEFSHLFTCLQSNYSASLLIHLRRDIATIANSTNDGISHLSRHDYPLLAAYFLRRIFFSHLNAHVIVLRVHLRTYGIRMIFIGIYVHWNRNVNVFRLPFTIAYVNASGKTHVYALRAMSSEYRIGISVYFYL